MKESKLTDENDYILQLVPSNPPALVLAKFCDEPQSAIFDFLSRFCSLRLLLDMIQHSNKGKVLVFSYLAAHTDKLDRYDCSNLEEYVINGQFSSLVKLYGAAISLKNLCSSLLTNNHAEQQLSAIVAKYRYKNKSYFQIYAGDEAFYLYFQKEALSLTAYRYEFWASHHFPWVIRDFQLWKLQDMVGPNSGNYNPAYFQQVIFHYLALKKRLHDNSALAVFLYDKAISTGLYANLGSVISDGNISRSFKKDLILLLIKRSFVNNSSFKDIRNPIIEMTHVLSLNEVVTVCIEYALIADSAYAKNIAIEIYAKITGPQRQYESQENYLKRIAVAILLNEYGIICDSPEQKYLTLMGEPTAEKMNFEVFVNKNPDKYFLAMNEIIKLNSDLPTGQLPDQFLFKFLTYYAHPITFNKYSADMSDFLYLLSISIMKQAQSAIFFPKWVIGTFITDGKVIFNQEQLTNLFSWAIEDVTAIPDLADVLKKHWLPTLMELGTDLSEVITLLIPVQKCTLLDDMLSASRELNFQKIHAKCKDPLGLALSHNATPERIQLMLNAGFDAKRYQRTPETMKNLHGENVIFKYLQNQLNKERAKGNAKKITLGIMQHNVESSGKEDTTKTHSENLEKDADVGLELS